MVDKPFNYNFFLINVNVHPSRVLGILLEIGFLLVFSNNSICFIVNNFENINLKFILYSLKYYVICKRKTILEMGNGRVVGINPWTI